MAARLVSHLLKRGNESTSTQHYNTESTVKLASPPLPSSLDTSFPAPSAQLNVGPFQHAPAAAAGASQQPHNVAVRGKEAHDTTGMRQITLVQYSARCRHMSIIETTASIPRIFWQPRRPEEGAAPRLETAFARLQIVLQPHMQTSRVCPLPQQSAC